MGSGRWDATSYAVSASIRASKGIDDFAYSKDTMSKPHGLWKVHEDLDPKRVNNDGAHKDANIREALDSDEHPTSMPIAVLFDVTGSMRNVPRELIKRLPDLYGLIIRKGYVEHPQVLFGAIGDATCDRVPLQVGQFESDNRADEDLGKIVLEGGGGGQSTESYELAAYFMARHTYTDAFEKRGEKGYLFIIGDEMPYQQVKVPEVEAHIGEDGLEAGLTVADIFAELREKWHVYIIRPYGGGYHAGEPGGDEVIEAWQNLLTPQYVIPLDDTSAVCDTIALTIGLSEGALNDLDEGLAHLEEITDGSTSVSVSKALAHVSSAATVAVADGPSDLT